MKQSRKMVLISEDEYAQLQAMTKPTEDVTESSVREHNNTEIGSPSEISTKPSEVSEKSTQTETMIPHFPYKVNVIPKKSTKKITKTNPPIKKLRKIDSTKHKLTQSGLGLTKIKPQGPPGIPVKKQQKKYSNGLPLGWMSSLIAFSVHFTCLLCLFLLHLSLNHFPQYRLLSVICYLQKFIRC